MRCTQLVQICDSCRDIHYSEDKCCPTCHNTYTVFDKSFDVSEHVAQCERTKVKTERQLHHDDPPPRIRLLKALLGLVEACICPEALQPFWSDNCRKSWGLKLHMSSSADDLLQVLTLLEGAIKKDYLSSNFQTTSELLASGSVVGYAVDVASTFGTVTVLPWIPQTTSAAALRLMELDSAISYLPEPKGTEKDTEKLPSSKCTVARNNIQEDELTGPHGVHQQEDALGNPESEHLGIASTRGSHGRGGRGRNRGGKSHRRIGGSCGEPSSRNLASSSRLQQVIGGWKAHNSRGKGGRRRGRGSVRSRQKPVKKSAASAAGQSNPAKLVMFDTSLPVFSGRNEWKGEESRQVVVHANNDSNSERSECEDDNGQAPGDEYCDLGIDDYKAVYNGKPGHLMNGDGYNMDDDEDDCDEAGDQVDCDEVGVDVDDDEVDVGAEYEQDVDVGGYLNAYLEDEGNGDEDGECDGDGDEDGSSESASTDYTSD